MKLGTGPSTVDANAGLLRSGLFAGIGRSRAGLMACPFKVPQRTPAASGGESRPADPDDQAARPEAVFHGESGCFLHDLSPGGCSRPRPGWRDALTLTA